MVDKLKTMVKSRRFWVGVAGLVVVFADAVFGEGTVNPETVTNVTLEQWSALITAGYLFFKFM